MHGVFELWKELYGCATTSTVYRGFNESETAPVILRQLLCVTKYDWVSRSQCLATEKARPHKVGNIVEMVEPQSVSQSVGSVV